MSWQPTNATPAPTTAEPTIAAFGERLRDTDYALKLFNRWEILVYLVWIPFMYVVARFVFYLSFRIRFADFDLRHHLTQIDNKAMSVSFAGYLLAVAIVVFGALSDQRENKSAMNLGTTVAWSLIGQGFLIIGEFLNDLCLHLKINYKEQIYNKNLSVGIVNAGVHIASGIVVAYTISGEVYNWGEAIISALILWAATQIAFIIFIHVYDLLARGTDVQEELLKDNTAVGITVCIGVIAAAVYVTSPIDKSESVVAVGLWFIVGLFVFIFIKFFTDYFLIPNTLRFDGTYVPNWGASSVQGCSIIFASLFARAFITYARCGEDKRQWKTRIVDWDFAKSMFEWYNLIFVFLIFFMMIILRLVFTLSDFVTAFLEKRSLARVFRQFLKVRVRDAPRALSQQVYWSPFLRTQLETSEAFQGGKKGAIIVFSTARCLEFSGFLIGVGFVINGALRATVNPTNKWGEVVGYFILWCFMGFTAVALSFAVTYNILWRDRRSTSATSPDSEVAKLTSTSGDAPAAATSAASARVEVAPAIASKPTSAKANDDEKREPENDGVEVDEEAQPELGTEMSRVVSDEAPAIGSRQNTGATGGDDAAITTTMSIPQKNRKVPLVVSARENVASSLVIAAGYLSSGLVVGSCLGSMQGGDAGSNVSNQDYQWGEDIATVAIFFAIAQALLIIAGRIYQYVTSYNDVEEIRRGNIAAGTSAALTWIAMAICASQPARKNDSILNIFLFFVLAVIVLHILRMIVDKVILFGESLDQEIAKDRNYGAALIEGAALIGMALCLTTFMPDQCFLTPL